MPQRLALGTVQFGLAYGVANREGQPDIDKAGNILRAAKDHEILTLDTAAAYGESETVLGKLGTKNFRVMTKLPPLSGKAIDQEWLRNAIASSLTKLQLSCVYAILLHRAEDLKGPYESVVTEGLADAKAQGLTEKTGVSIYDPEDLDGLPTNFDVDIVQAPVNILDRRILSCPQMLALKKTGTLLHARSAYLQGLLLQPREDRHPYFQPWSEQLDGFTEQAERAQMSPIQACLGFMKAQSLIDEVVVGADSADQLEQTALTYAAVQPFHAQGLACEDKALVNPANWILS